MADMSADGSSRDGGGVPDGGGASNAVRVLISYSHDSEEHSAWVLRLAQTFRDEGIDCNIDQFEPHGPDVGWTKWMLAEIERSKFVLMVCTEIYRRRFEGKETGGQGKGVTYEGAIISLTLYEQYGQNTKFIPIVRDNADRVHIPVHLRDFNCYRPDEPKDYDRLYARLTDQTPKLRNSVGVLRQLKPKTALQQFRSVGPAHTGADVSRPLAPAATPRSTATAVIQPELQQQLDAVTRERDALRSMVDYVIAAGRQIYYQLTKVPQPPIVIEQDRTVQIERSGDGVCSVRYRFRGATRPQQMVLERIGGDEPLASIADLALSVESKTKGADVVWMPALDIPREKAVIIFLLPQIEPREERDVLIRWRWPKMWLKLTQGQADEWVELVKSARKQIPSVRFLFRLHPQFPDIRLFKPGANGEAEREARGSVGADGYKVYELGFKRVPGATELTLRLESR